MCENVEISLEIACPLTYMEARSPLSCLRAPSPLLLPLCNEWVVMKLCTRKNTGPLISNQKAHTDIFELWGLFYRRLFVRGKKTNKKNRKVRVKMEMLHTICIRSCNN